MPGICGSAEQEHLTCLQDEITILPRSALEKMSCEPKRIYCILLYTSYLLSVHTLPEFRFLDSESTENLLLLVFACYCYMECNLSKY